MWCKKCNRETEEKKCSVCGTITVAQETIPAKGHTEVTVSGKAATCVKAGLTDGQKCSVCGTVTVEQQVINATGHTEVTVTGMSATCTASGLTDGKKCSVSGRIDRLYQAPAEDLHPAQGIRLFRRAV